jgi:hypothetical protein
MSAVMSSSGESVVPDAKRTRRSRRLVGHRAERSVAETNLRDLDQIAQSTIVDIMPTLRQTEPVNDARALAEIQRLARLDRIIITRHANQRMNDRGATDPDVRKALLTATAATHQADRDNWRVEGGVDTDGDDLTLICDIGVDVIVVTLF